MMRSTKEKLKNEKTGGGEEKQNPARKRRTSGKISREEGCGVTRHTDTKYERCVCQLRRNKTRRKNPTIPRKHQQDKGISKTWEQKNEFKIKTYVFNWRALRTGFCRSFDYGILDLPRPNAVRKHALSDTIRSRRTALIHTASSTALRVIDFYGRADLTLVFSFT